MRYIALATDYDGTLAHDGVVSQSTISALERVRKSGRKLILVTGRELPDLEKNFSKLELFDSIVAENGALLYNPATRASRTLADPPPQKLIDRLRQRGVSNISTGKVIVALWKPHEQEAIAAIRDLGLELQVVFNKDAVMILPSGVNKQTGLIAALKELKVSPHSTIGVGDAENDHAFLACCECAVAVANAIPSVKEEADLVTTASHGDGVCELIDRLLENDLADLSGKLKRHDIRLGKSETAEVAITVFGTGALVCGQSGGGKSTLISGIVERLAVSGYQVCLIDPEGDYEHAAEFVTTGGPKHAPSLDHIEKILDDPGAQVAVNLVGVQVDDRPALFGRILALLQQHRVSSGRPHWLIVDEAHHMFPTERTATEGDLSADRGSFVLVTVHPRHVSSRVLKEVNLVIVVGKEPAATIKDFCEVVGKTMPPVPDGELPPGDALVWHVDTTELLRVKTEPPQMPHERHKRKYAEGQLEEERVFYFRGPEGKLNLRAQNLTVFIQLAAGVDDETWCFHLKLGDYSKWLRDAVKDPDLADEVADIERDQSLSAANSRTMVAQTIQARYTVQA
jgi:hypothetical protein